MKTRKRIARRISLFRFSFFLGSFLFPLFFFCFVCFFSQRNFRIFLLFFSHFFFSVNAPSEYYNPSDVTKFLQLSGLPIQSVSQFKGDQVTFGCPSLLCAEPVLDVEMLIGKLFLSLFFSFSSSVLFSFLNLP